MKKLLTLILPASALTAVVLFAAAVSHTENRFCGSHCHHHGHYWSCGGYTYYCCGH
jgi:hypothetical protein